MNRCCRRRDVREVGAARIALGRTGRRGSMRDVRQAVLAAQARSRAAQTLDGREDRDRVERGLARVLVVGPLALGLPERPHRSARRPPHEPGAPGPVQGRERAVGGSRGPHVHGRGAVHRLLGAERLRPELGRAGPRASVKLTRSEFPRVPGMVRVERTSTTPRTCPRTPIPGSGTW